MAAISREAAQGQHGTAVIATSYLFIIITLIFVALRVTTAVLRRRKFGIDDILLVSAMLLGLLSAICMGNAVINGLGRPITTVHSGQLSRYFKLSYASHIFTILAMGAAQQSIVALILRSVPQTAPSYRYVRLLHLVIIAWMIFSVFGIAFQCDVPDPWIYSPTRCTGHGVIWYPLAAFGMVIDIVLAFGFMPIIKAAEVDSKRRTKVASLFLARLVVPVLAIAHVVVLTPALGSFDQTWVMAIPSILLQTTMNLSILTAAMPALSRAVIALDTASQAAVVSEITAVNLDPSHSRATSDENNKLRDWAFAQLRNSPTPNSLIKDISLTDRSESPVKPEQLHLRLERSDTAPPVPPRSVRRSGSPMLTLNLDLTNRASHLDLVKEAWFVDVDNKRTSSMTQTTQTTVDTIDDVKRPNSIIHH